MSGTKCYSCSTLPYGCISESAEVAAEPHCFYLALPFAAARARNRISVDALASPRCQKNDLLTLDRVKDAPTRSKTLYGFFFYKWGSPRLELLSGI